MKARLAAVAVALTLAVSTSSCLGPNNAYNGLQSWNANISESDIAREALFLGMMIIPVYPVALWVDYVVLNTIEYWSGDNPVKASTWPDNFHKGD